VPNSRSPRGLLWRCLGRRGGARLVPASGLPIGDKFRVRRDGPAAWLAGKSYAGDEAKQTLDDLADELEQGRDDIDNAVEGADNLQSLLAAVPTVTQTFTTLSGEVAQAFSSLQQLDAQGELEDAFSQADSCDELENS